METEGINLYLDDFKVDVIIPTADVSKWPFKQSLEWNMNKAHKASNVKFIPVESSGDNFSFSKSINCGIELARDDSDLFLLNDDCFMDSFWIELLYSAKISHPKCGIFGATLRFPDWKDAIVNSNYDADLWNGLLSGRKALNHWKPKYQHAGGYIPLTLKEQLAGMVRFGFWNLSPFFVLRQVIKTPDMGFRFPGHYHTLKRTNKIHLITAAGMLITRDAFNELGYFDQQLPLSFNDTDYSLRALQHDIGLCLVSDCTGVHYESLTTNHLEEKKRHDYRTFYRKWNEEKLKKLLTPNNKAIVHPEFCQCGDWIE
jgi:GT2 family glycosyltransferase